MKALTPEQLNIIRRVRATAETPNRVKMAMVLTATTLRQLDAEIPLTYTQISQITCGRNSNLTLRTARPFAAFFGCSIDDLFPARQDTPTEERLAS